MGIIDKLSGIFKKKPSVKITRPSGPVDQRMGHRRKAEEDRREEVRWEPEKEPRRQNSDQRKSNNLWKDSK